MVDKINKERHLECPKTRYSNKMNGFQINFKFKLILMLSITI